MCACSIGDSIGTILCITGRTGAGKSTVARAIAEEFSIPFYGFGNYERQKWMDLFGYKSPAEYWTKLGLEVGHFGLYQEHIEQVRARISENGIAVESIYSESMLNLLGANFSDYGRILVSVVADERLRFERFKARESAIPEDPEYEFETMERFKVRIGVLKVMEKPDFVIANMGSMKTLIDVIRTLKRDINFGGSA